MKKITMTILSCLLLLTVAYAQEKSTNEKSKSAKIKLTKALPFTQMARNNQ